MKTEPSAKVILDSISSQGFRLTTMEVVMHRFVLAEFNTHRVFSRNSASSRAIPAHKQRSRVLTDPAMPIEFGTNQRGMQAAEPLDEEDTSYARYNWVKASQAAVEASRILDESLNVHKQIANRPLEPWMWHTVIVTATEWAGFFEQRCSELAQPEIRVVAELMRDAYRVSNPIAVSDNIEYWHTPYIQGDEASLDIETKKAVSAARCARVSYLTHDGTRDVEKDLELYNRLVTASPPHFSPLEHVATPYKKNVAMIYNERQNTMMQKSILGNFTGWHQLRHILSGERIL